MKKRILVDGTLEAMTATVKRFYPDGFPECKPAKVRRLTGIAEELILRALEIMSAPNAKATRIWKLEARAFMAAYMRGR